MKHSAEVTDLRFTTLAAASLGLVWLGDALIYVVLPLYPAAFGVDTAMVGILLSINRVVRIAGYGWVSPLACRFGANALTAGACCAAALSTIAYGWASGFVVMLVARLIWGAAYGVLNVTNSAYAYGDGVRAATRMGINRGVSSLGPVLALGVGGWLVTVVGPQNVFLIFGAIGFASIPLALLLPALPAREQADPSQSPKRWTPSALNMVFFITALAADGVFTATLSTLLADLVPLSSALIGAGLLLALQRLVGVALAFASGPMIDRFQSRRLLLPCGLVVAAGLAGIAAGYVYSAAVVIIVARALLATVAPVIAAQQSSDRIGAIAAYATWTDCGLAAGAFLGIVAVASIGYALTYATLALAVVVVVAWEARVRVLRE